MFALLRKSAYSASSLIKPKLGFSGCFSSSREEGLGVAPPRSSSSPGAHPDFGGHRRGRLPTEGLGVAPHSSSSPGAHPDFGGRGRGHLPTEVLGRERGRGRGRGLFFLGRKPGPPAAQFDSAHSSDPGTPRIMPIPEDAIIFCTDASVENKLFTTGMVARWNRDGSVLFEDIQREAAHLKIDDDDSNYYESCAIRKGMLELIKRGYGGHTVFFICDNDAAVHLLNREKKARKKQSHMWEVVAHVKRLKSSFGAGSEIYGQVFELKEGVDLLSKVRGEKGQPVYEKGKEVAMAQVEKEKEVFPLRPGQLFKMLKCLTRTPPKS